MTAYRDRPLKCPRCERELRREQAREAWSCDACAGMLIGVGELITELVQIAPSLIPDGRIRSITTLGRRTSAPPVRCPTCAADMEPVFLGGVDVDRCYHDEVMWFDRGEVQAVVERARDQQEEATLAQRLLRWFG